MLWRCLLVGWGDGSIIKSTGWTIKRTWARFPTWWFIPSVTLFSGGLTYVGTTYTLCTYIHVGKRAIHINTQKKERKEKRKNVAKSLGIRNLKPQIHTLVVFVDGTFWKERGLNQILWEPNDDVSGFLRESSYVCWHIPLIQARGRQKQVDLYDFKISLVCILSSRPIGMYSEILSQKISKWETSKLIGARCQFSPQMTPSATIWYTPRKPLSNAAPSPEVTIPITGRKTFIFIVNYLDSTILW